MKPAREVGAACRGRARSVGLALAVCLSLGSLHAAAMQVATINRQQLREFNAVPDKVNDPKGKRAYGLSSAVQSGEVVIVRGPWNDAYITELANFDPDNDCFKDQVDASSGAYNKLVLTAAAPRGLPFSIGGKR